MTRWIRSFDLPGTGWLQLAVNDPDGAERAAREIAERDGEGMPEYAEAVYPELKAIRENMGERDAAPVAVYVPPVPPATRPLIPVSAYVEGRRWSPAERSMETVLAEVGRPQPYRFGEPGITVVELPAGPACRLHEVVLHDRGDDGRRFMTEHLDHFVLPPECPEGIFMFSVTWSSLAIGADMAATADAMAASLRITREPR
ncbi:hypothetical protein [Streptomyces hoynatensis]|uniref:Uncharacterized protein n=1 Tax=Streptomyces hoynatensis TaxID=1141874 RepID=A0A3A9ZB89_9ACTN|nr:hypothetical protein [Streptomyces hoynatensis]RKN45553.1 hypothetical protein D7294_03465 [Streptomyces hoynatensis]